MLPSFIRSFLWGSEEHCFPVTNEEHFVTEQQDDWLLISEQGKGIKEMYNLLALP